MHGGEANGGLQWLAQPATQSPQVSGGLLWLAWQLATQPPHTAYEHAYAQTCVLQTRWAAGGGSGTNWGRDCKIGILG